jgi:hypothetical protein
MRTHRNGKPLTVLADGHPRRMADGKNAFRKMSREQREEFVIWMLDNGLEQTVAHQRIAREQLDSHLERQEEIAVGKRVERQLRGVGFAAKHDETTIREIVSWAVDLHRLALGDFLDLSDEELQNLLATWEEIS